MKIQLLIRYLSAMACSMVFLLNSVFAGIDPPVRKILDGNLNQLNVDSFALVEDSKFFDPAYNSVLIKPYKVVNTITFRINESSLYYLQSDFSATVQLRVKFTRADNSIDSVDKTLTVNYDADTTYTNKSLYLLGESGYRVEVKVLSVSDNVSWDVWKSLQVVNELQSYPQYQFSCTGDALQQIDHIALDPSSEIDELPVSWANRITADEYDLEWTYIDSSALASYRYGNP